MAIAALSEGVITPATTFTCTGSVVMYGQTFDCDKHEAHGTLNLRQAIEQSCNVYFYHVADLLTIDQIHEYAEKLGLIGKTGIDLPGEVDSLVPSTAWKMKTTGEKWYPGETISVGIGQGQVSVTPISLATMMSTVANGGTIITPHVVKAIDNGGGWVPTMSAPRAIFPINPEILAPVRDGLWMVVNGEGTGSNARIAGHDVVGKTGTAQVISKEGATKAAAGKTTTNLRDNSWFVFYASKDNPEIAGVVFAEHEGYGALSAAPIARYVLETYFAKKEGREMPRLVMGADGEVQIVTSTSPAVKKTEPVAQPAGHTGGGEE
jgi:penicillin-binding protein 2